MYILIACDSLYYSKWAVNCVNSIRTLVPWINVVVILVNSDSVDEIPGVRYVYDRVSFNNDESKVAYFQAVRFIKCAELFSNNELVMSIDCDTILTKSFSKESFKDVCSTVHVQKHHRKDRWMAGLVTYGNNNNFRNKLQQDILSRPIDSWEYGWDQRILNKLATEFNYTKLEVGDWMSFGKGSGIFLTLKGDQKVAEKYLKNYNNIKEKLNAKT